MLLSARDRACLGTRANRIGIAAVDHAVGCSPLNAVDDSAADGGAAGVLLDEVAVAAADGRIPGIGLNGVVITSRNGRPHARVGVPAAAADGGELGFRVGIGNCVVEPAANGGPLSPRPDGVGLAPTQPRPRSANGISLAAADGGGIGTRINRVQPTAAHGAKIRQHAIGARPRVESRATAGDRCPVYARPGEIGRRPPNDIHNVRAEDIAAGRL